MKARKFNWALNVITLAAMALALVVAPMTPASAGTETVQGPPEVHIYPPNAESYAHYIFLFQITRSVPINSTLYVKFPQAQYDPDGDGDWTDSRIPNLTYDTGDPRLAEMLVSWGPARANVFGADPNVVPAPTESDPPNKSLAWRDPLVNWLEDGEVRVAVPTDEVPEGYWVRIDFWGPESINPGQLNAGIQNPEEEGNYCWYVATDEETQWVEVCEDIDPPFPVRLYRKMQIPLYNSGYTELEYIDGFYTIWEALIAADSVWLNEEAFDNSTWAGPVAADLIGDYRDEPFWNLFGPVCPDFSTFDPHDGDDDAAEQAFLNAAKRGVAIGAVIMVAPGTYTDRPRYVHGLNGWSEVLLIDTPGLIVGSTEGREVTIIEAEEEALVDMATPVGDAAIGITAGAVTFGESEILVWDDDADDYGIVHLYGFTVQNAGQNVWWWDDDHEEFDDFDANGIAVYPGQSEKCYDEDVFSAVVQEWGLLDSVAPTVNFTITEMIAGGDALVFTDTTGFDLTQFAEGAKLANLTTAWAGHIDVVDCALTVHGGFGIGSVCLQLRAGPPANNLIEINAERFKHGDAIAIFDPSTEYTCEDARVDVRDNVVTVSTLNGIEAYSTAIWVDGNDVHNNEVDGFFGDLLRCCDVLMVQDGINRTPEMLEISNNQFHENGLDAVDDWAGTFPEGCFDPYPQHTTGDAGNDSGIEIESTTMAECAEVEEYNLLIHDNNIYGNEDAGIWLWEGAANCGIRILWNEIHGNEVFGVSNWALTDYRGDGGDDSHGVDWVEPNAQDEVDVIFRYNNVYGNNFWGVKNWVRDWPAGPYPLDYDEDAGPMFNAKENFWGMFGEVVDPSGGPSEGPVACVHEDDQQSEAMGYGDAVCKGTFWNPWLSVESNLLRVLPGYQHLRAYGSDSLLLQAGWNTLAVPLPLDSGANSLEEISALGTFLMEDGAPKWEAAYQYDNEAEAWLAIDGLWDPSKDIQAVHGYFIKIDSELAPGGTKFPVIYGKTLVDLPAYDLVPGWNLIGSAFGIDRDGTDTDADQGRWAVADPDDNDGEAYKAVSVTLESIIDWTGQSGLSMIVDPWVPGQILKGWPAPALTVQQAANLDMATGEAYWVYMKTAGALGGFEYAPLFFNADPPLPAK